MKKQSDNRQKTDKKKAPHTAWKPGHSGNPGGRPKLPAEIKALKDASLQRAVILLHDKLHNKMFVKKVKPADLIKFIETAFDRFGLPKVTKNEMEGEFKFSQMPAVKISGKGLSIEIG